MKQQLREQVISISLNTQTRNAGTRDLYPEKMLKRNTENMRHHHADDAGMRNHQHMFPTITLVQVVPRTKYPVAKCHQWFGATGGVRQRIAAEAVKHTGFLCIQFLGRATFPIAETQLGQTSINLQRQPMTPGQLAGKIGAARQWRTDNRLPRTVITHRLTHLRPAFFIQGVVELSAVFAATHGFTMAHQVQDRAWFA